VSLAKTIGIVGGGQLGRMLTLAAKPLGFDVIVVDPTGNSPAAQVGAEEIVAGFYDAEAIAQLTSRSHHVTVESEHINVDALEKAIKTGSPVHPSPATIRLIQDKYLQKVFLKEVGLPVGEFTRINNEQAALEVLKQYGGKMIIKTRRNAFDGRGNKVVKSPADVKAAFKKFGDQKLYAEKLVPFTKELAVMVARSTKGEVATYPLSETIHKRNICHEVLVPAPVTKNVQQKAIRLARKVADQLAGAGVFGIEMFLTSDGKVLINEIAPRVHNSGHYTTEACMTSQFEQHIRAIAGLPLGKTDLLVPAAVMINILGERNGPTKVQGMDDCLAIPGVSVHLYGKSPTKIDRKMGHITAIGKTMNQARTRARKARKALSI
jgi:5-(carboxyamino)imidazole ribonucleotide synthase